MVVVGQLGPVCIVVVTLAAFIFGYELGSRGQWEGYGISLEASSSKPPEVEAAPAIPALAAPSVSRTTVLQPVQPAALAAQQPDIPAGSLVFDFGFFDGTDSLSYLGQGFNVVAVEADPRLADAARADPGFTAAMQSGQLKLLNVAIAPAGEQQWTTFYKSKCTKEWNSFYSSVGCRSCPPPHTENMNSCDAVQVQATSCAQILQQFGVPRYFKLDIEGAETGCYQAIKALPQAQLPRFISGELGPRQNLVAALHDIGYQSFKLVSQSVGKTGPLGSRAQDFRTGSLWRSYEGALKELNAMKELNGTGFGAWYDVHASTSPPQTA